MRRRRLPRSGPNFIGLLFFLAIIIGGFFAAIRFGPLFLNNRIEKASVFNLAIAGSKTSFLSLNTIKKSAVLVNFPDDLYIPEVAFGYGQYRISSVFSVGELDRRGGRTLAQTLQEYLGLPIDGYVYLSVQGGLKKIILSKDFLTSKSDLSMLEKLQLAYIVFNLREDKIKTVDLYKLTTPLVLADGSEAKSLEKEDLDNFLSGVFFEENLQNEDLRVEVVNTTKIVGLGNRVSRLLTNIGIAVVNVDSSSLLLDSCKIEANTKAFNSKTVARIAKIFNCNVSKTELNGRADARVLIGFDYAKKIAP